MIRIVYFLSYYYFFSFERRFRIRCDREVRDRWSSLPLLSSTHSCFLPTTQGTTTDESGHQKNEVRVEGLETLDYLDNLKNRERFTEQGDAITFEAEVDKISQHPNKNCNY
ncbi:hypothetical protein FH972_017314 [Carpinus fangiana]|uniref:Uncharacterized protein n=1 Tax=Carpinus fangiana TaxID=176857 RepID=A0A5N6RJX2_9ROSI|nr:hypothetical protein FH972_017314 [Carpinus fangiana]